MQRTIRILLLIALLLPSVSAQDFLAFGDLNVNAVPCGTTVRNVTVQNTREVQSVFSLSVDGDASDYVTFSLVDFVLNPSQAAIINTFYNIPCDVRPGIYYTDLYFYDGEVEKVLTQEVNVAIPDNINVSTTDTSAVIAPCGTAGYTLNLHNPLEFTEIYTVSAAGHDNVHVSHENVVLQAGQRTSVVVSVTPEDCTEAGIFPLTVQIESDKSAQLEELTLELIITATDIPRLAEGISTIRTDYIDSTADLTIENLGDRTTQYRLQVDGIQWASISPTTVNLDPGQSKIIALRLTPTEDVPKGKYTLFFDAIVEETGIVYSKEITIKLQPPTIWETNPTLAIAIIVIILAVIVGAFFLVRYTRSSAFKAKKLAIRQAREAKRKEKEKKRAERFRQKLEKRRKEIAWQVAEQERITRDIQRQTERELKKEYHLVARKELVQGKQKRSTLKIAALVLGVLVILLVISAWSLIAPNAGYVLLGLVILGVILLAKKLSRNKVIRARWKTLLKKQTKTLHGWKKGLSTLSITAKQPIDRLRLLVRKTRIRASPSPAVYQTFEIKTNAEEGSTGFKATFTVSKHWIARKKANPEDVRIGRYVNQSWQTVPLRKTGESKNSVHFTADLGKTGTYSIYARLKKQKAKPMRKIVWAIIGIAVIAAIAIALAPRGTTSPHVIPAQVWQQDMVHRIDLGQYFEDPDGDRLTYSATKTSHITIDISGSVAYLTPDTGWTGEERVRFIADDGKGGKVPSNTVPLRVQENIIPAHIQPYIAIVLAIIAILLLIWTVRSQKNSQNKR